MVTVEPDIVEALTAEVESVLAVSTVAARELTIKEEK